MNTEFGHSGDKREAIVSLFERLFDPPPGRLRAQRVNKTITPDAMNGRYLDSPLTHMDNAMAERIADRFDIT